MGLLVFQGIGATGGGAMLVADPSGASMGWTTDMIARSPFATYAWPGIILGAGLGLTALLLAWGVARRPDLRVLGALERATGHHWSWVGSIGLGVGLMAWIVVQLTLIDVRTFLQPVMFGVGAAIVATALLPDVRRWLGRR